MNIPLFLFLLFALQIACYWYSTKTVSNSNSDDYYIAGKKVHFFPLMMTFIATQIGGSLVLGACEEAYRFGWSVLFYPMGQILGLALLSTKIGQKMAERPVTTVAAIFEEAYGSVRLKYLASFLSIISLFMILIAQFIASQKFIASFGIDSTLLYGSFWGIVILYTVFGGLKAVIATDVIQALFFIIIFSFAFFYTFVKNFDACQSLLQPETTVHMAVATPKMVLSWTILPLLFMFIEQDMGQRIFAAKTPGIARRAARAAALISACVAVIPIVIGVLARSLGIEAEGRASIFMTAISFFTNPEIASIVSCAILAAIVSTADSLMNAISSNISQDFFKKIQLKKAQVITGIIAIGGLCSAQYFDRIVPIVMMSYELSVCMLFVPIFLVLLGFRGTYISAWWSVIVGGITYILLKIFPIGIPTEIIAIISSFVSFCAAELIMLFLKNEQTT